MKGRTILVTGATDGLGRGVAERLAADAATVLLHGRDPERLAATKAGIRQATGNDHLHTYRADLADLSQVHGLANQIKSEHDHLHVLISNAGIGSGEPDGRERRTSVDGHELRFAVNYLAGFLLTAELLPLITASAPARIVYVASLGQQALDFDDVMLERGYSGTRAYAQSKLAQITAAMELSERLRGTGVTVNSLHPSTYMPTKMVMHEIGRSVDSLEDGVSATVRLATDRALDDVTGRFFDRQRESRAQRQAYDPEARRRLWDLSLTLTGAPDIPSPAR